MIIKDKQPNSKKRLWIVIAAVLLLLALAVGGYVFWLNTKQGKEYQSNAAQKASDTETKKDFIENTNNKGDESTGNTSPTVPSDPANITISTNDENNGSLTILTKLVGYSDGQCDLSITNGSQKYTASAQVIFQPEYSTCAGFSVDKSKLGTGTWNIALTVTSKGGQVVKQQKVDVH